MSIRIKFCRVCGKRFYSYSDCAKKCGDCMSKKGRETAKLATEEQYLKRKREVYEKCGSHS